ncbi:MAG: HIRAN domain-containing protein [Tissierellia bacterium]|nr:HIRAN domain-containing protein [Tissierellia bacterium]
MKKLLKIFWIAATLICVIGGFGSLADGNTFVGIVFLFIGLGNMVHIIKERRESKKPIKKANNTTEKPIKESTQKPMETPMDKPIEKPIKPVKKPIKTIETYVAGVQHENDQGKFIQKIIKDYVKENYDYSNFEDYTNKEILEDAEDVWEYDLEEVDSVKLVPEPTNPYDPNAIKIIHEDMGHIGYVPAKMTSKVCKVPDKEATYTLELKGGRHKYWDIDEYGEEKVKSETRPYYFDLIIEWEEE